MVGVLIRMKLAILRHSATGQRAADMIGGGLAGLVLAGGTIWLAAHAWPVAGLSLDLVGAAFAIWVVGWLFGPVLFGGGGETLRPEHLALLPFKPRKLAAGLLATAFVGVAPAVSLIAFAALVVAAWPLGGTALLTAVLAVALQLLFVVLASRFASAALGQLMRSKLGAILAAVISGGILAVTHTGWMLKPTIQAALTEGFPGYLHDWVRRLPSGWGAVAVESAQRGDWAMVAASLGGLAALSLLAMLGWSVLLVRRMSHRQASGRPAATRKATRTVRPGRARAVAGRELRTTARDLMRFHYLAFALVYALTFCLVPLVVHIPILVPFIGVAFGIWSAAVSANLYGEDGTSLWMTLLVPGAARHDVRGRQLSWLLLTAPPTVMLTVVPTVISGQDWAWPWLGALVPALLGGGAGIIVLVSVLRPTPMTDPNKRSGNLLENGTDFTQVLLMLVLMTAAAAPAFLTAKYGSSWSGTVTGLATGTGLYWLLGDLAAKRLERTGPDMLAAMRSAVTTEQKGPAVDLSSLNISLEGADLGHKKLGITHATPRRTALVYTLLAVCWVPLCAQGLVPAYLSFSDPQQRSWFLARRVPHVWQWPVIAVMIATGLTLLVIGLMQLRKARRESAEAVARELAGRESTRPADPLPTRSRTQVDA